MEDFDNKSLISENQLNLPDFNTLNIKYNKLLIITSIRSAILLGDLTATQDTLNALEVEVSKCQVEHNFDIEKYCVDRVAKIKKQRRSKLCLPTNQSLKD